MSTTTPLPRLAPDGAEARPDRVARTPIVRRELRGPAALASLLREAVGSLATHPLRSLLTALSVTFGAAVLVVLVSYGTAMPDATSEMLQRMGGGEFKVEPRRARRGGGGVNGRQIQIRYSDIGAIRDACPSIAAIAPAYRPMRGGPAFSATRSWPYAGLTGVGHEYRDVTELRILTGRWFTEEEEQLAEEVALLNKPLADGMYDGAPLGRTIDFAGRRFRIIGTFESDAVFSFGVLVPYPTTMEMGDSGGRFVSSLAFKPRRPDLARAAISEIKGALGTLYSFDPDDPLVLDVEENTAFVEKVGSVTLGLEWLVLTIAGLALMLGCLGAANVVGIAVAERTAELGLRKALGATASRVRAEVLTETLLLCLGGGILGVLVGSAVIAATGPLAMSEQITLMPRADVSVLGFSLFVLVVTATVAGLPAANRAARLDPVVALRED